MIQNPFVVSEVARMQRQDHEERRRRSWELGLNELENPSPSRWTNFTWTLGSFVLAWLAVWALSLNV